MSISDKARKKLWGRSGNKCAVCKVELVIDSNSEKDESIVGDECHIVSGKIGGPRYNEHFPKDMVDSYENLILLCKTHHKMVDDQYSIYTPIKLKEIKKKHEKWRFDHLSTENNSPPKPNFKLIRGSSPEYLNRITTGRELSNIIAGACDGSFYNDEPKTLEEAQVIEDFLDLIEDVDLLPELGLKEKARIEFDLTQRIENLDLEGFAVFGGREKNKLDINGQIEDWPRAIIWILRKTNKDIIKIEADQKEGSQGKHNSAV
jgi:hypothetical protein